MSEWACKTCKTCLWWTDFSKFCGTREGVQIPMTARVGDCRTVSLGRCHRYAPRPMIAETREDYWCGEYEKNAG